MQAYIRNAQALRISWVWCQWPIYIVCVCVCVYIIYMYIHTICKLVCTNIHLQLIRKTYGIHMYAHMLMYEYVYVYTCIYEHVYVVRTEALHPVQC